MTINLIEQHIARSLRRYFPRAESIEVNFLPDFDTEISAVIKTNGEYGRPEFILVCQEKEYKGFDWWELRDLSGETDLMITIPYMET